MKKSEIGIRLLCGICVGFCWWGLLYPEFTMTPDTYKVCWEKEEEMDSEEDIYKMLLEADREQIRFRSRLWEYLRR